MKAFLLDSSNQSEQRGEQILCTSSTNEEKTDEYEIIEG